MSEDIDIAIDREYLGYGGKLSRTQISDKLRRAACSFVREKLQSSADVRTSRMSRHLYDIYQIMDTPIADRALNDKDLYLSVMEHRRIFIGLRGFRLS